MNNETKKRLTAAAVKTFDLACFANINLEAASNTLRSDLDDLLGLNDPKVMNQRYDFFKVPGSEPKNYEERVVQISNRKSVLAGIRHAGGNKEKPFINLWPDYEFMNIGDVNEAYEAFAEQFEVFSPKHLSFWLNPNLDFAKELESTVKPNLRYIVGSIAKIKRKQKPDNYQKVSLAPVKDNNYRDWYEQLYMDFHSRNNELKDWVPVNNDEDMDSCLKDRLLFFIYIEGKKAGLIGGRKQDLLGKSGLYFTEIVLSTEFKGKGFAPAAQRMFIDHLSSDIEVIWGTIDCQNVSSTKTALRVGRSAIRSEFFLPLNAHYT